jgi:predicted DNA-binding protein (MmcQ/YjbR family)
MKKHEEALRKQALGYPEVHEDFPWGESLFKVRKKGFLFMRLDEKGGSLGLSVKLPQSGASALMLPFAEPTGYGLGKAGWVTASFKAGDKVPMPLLREWLEESYRANAPKTIVAKLK